MDASDAKFKLPNHHKAGQYWYRLSGNSIASVECSTINPRIFDVQHEMHKDCCFCGCLFGNSGKPSQFPLSFTLYSESQR